MKRIRTHICYSKLHFVFHAIMYDSTVANVCNTELHMPWPFMTVTCAAVNCVLYSRQPFVFQSRLTVGVRRKESQKYACANSHIVLAPAQSTESQKKSQIQRRTDIPWSPKEFLCCLLFRNASAENLLLPVRALPCRARVPKRPGCIKRTVLFLSTMVPQ